MTRLIILAVLVIIFALACPHIHRVTIRDVSDVVIENQRLTDHCWEALAGVEAVIEGQWATNAALVDCENARR